LLFGSKPASDASETVIFDVSKLKERVHRLETELREQTDELSQLKGHHLKLRKQFDGSKGGRPNEGGRLSDVPVGDKQALRRALGVVPGARFIHQQE
jgi:predicted RNase H-like nuclease (RuvC/YqgF family)